MKRYLSRSAVFAILVGAGVLAVLLIANDPLLTWRRVTEAGWAIVLISVYRALPLALDTAGWRVLFDPDGRPAPGRALLARWIGESVNTLLPVAQVGGDVVRARLVAGTAPGGMVAASAATTADFALGLVAQLLFTLAGIAALSAALAPGSDAVSSWALVVAVLLFAVPVAGFFGWQRIADLPWLGPWLRVAVRQLGSRFDLTLLTEFRERLGGVYRRRAAVAGCIGWRLAGWLARTAETGIILWLLGVPVEFAQLVAIESLSYAVRSVAFFVPGALGVQEAGILGLGLALGLPPEVALALAVIKRAREAVVGLPALAVWASPLGRRHTGATNLQH